MAIKKWEEDENEKEVSVDFFHDFTRYHDPSDISGIVGDNIQDLHWGSGKQEPP